MKEKKKQPTTSKKSSHNTLDWVEKELKDVVVFDMGTSIQKIESTYGHIQVEQQADVITKSQSHIVNAGFVLPKPEVIEEEEEKYISKDSLSSAKYDVTVQKRSNKSKVTV